MMVDLNAQFRQAAGRFQQGDLVGAQTLAQGVLALQSDHADANFLLGIIAAQRGQLALACPFFERAIQSSPSEAEYHYYLGLAMQRGGQQESALTAYTEAVRLLPGYMEAHNNRGAVLRALNRPVEALAAYDRVVALNPEMAEAHHYRGAILAALGRREEALLAYERAIELRPGFAEAQNNRGAVLIALNRPVEALAAFDQALELNAEIAEIYKNRAGVLAGLFDQEEALLAYERAVEMKPDDTKTHSDMLLFLAAQACLPPDLMLEELYRWDRAHGQAGRLHPLPARVPEPAVDRRLRVGYVSPDLREHAVSYFFEPLLANHDRSSFEVFCYDANEKVPDATTERLLRIAEHWRRVNDKTDAELANLIHADRIDILVDLAGHTVGNRLKAFTYRPAPVQATYLGYFASTGLKAMDYWITDAVLHPPNTPEPSVERIVRMSRCSHCYQPPQLAPEVSHCPNVDEQVVFGSFSNLAKLTPMVVSTWCQVLHALPGSQLQMVTRYLDDPKTRQLVLDHFTCHGIPAERLCLKSAPGMKEWLSTYASVDIVLDPFPRTGTTTTAEALWMGVPVVTLMGQYYVERASAGVLTSIGLDDLIAQSSEEYLDKAVSLARDPGRREALRAGMRERMRQSLLCDGKGLAIAMEDAYRAMWEEYISAYKQT